MFSNFPDHFSNLKARNFATLAIAKAGGLDLEFVNTFNYPELKPTLPFNQLPLLIDGDIRLAQSNAILRYVANKAGLDGRDDPKYFALSEMLIEEAGDIFTMFFNANRAADRIEQYNKLFAADGPM
jgi:glutathione S-transferase